MRLPALLGWILFATAPAALALPPPGLDPLALIRAGEAVASIPIADRIQDFQHLDDEHVVLSTGPDQHYLVRLNRHCLGLRWAQHVGITASRNTVWAGFDSVTADGESCSIEAIHRLPNSAGSAPDN